MYFFVLVFLGWRYEKKNWIKLLLRDMFFLNICLNRIIYYLFRLNGLFWFDCVVICFYGFLCMN